MNPTEFSHISAFPIDAKLTQIAIAYRNPAMALIADEVMPPTLVGTKSYKWMSFSSEQNFTIPNTLVGRKGEPEVVELFGTEESGSVLDYGLDDILPRDEIIQAERDDWGFNPQERATELLTDLLMLDREKRVATVVQNAQNYASGQTQALAGNTQWSNYETSKPRETILKALDVPLLRPNVMVIGQEAWTILRQHPSLVSSVLGNDGKQGAITTRQLADLLEIPKVLVGASFINSSRKGQSPAFQRTWGKHAAFLHINPTASTGNGISWGYTVQFGTKFVRAFDENQTGLRGSVKIRVGMSCQEQVVAPHVGYLFTNVVA